MTHWAAQYVGRSWVENAQGPDAFDCWGLVRYVQREHFGRDVPFLDVEAVRAMTASRHAFSALRSARSGWEQVSQPKDGAGVVLCDLIEGLHVGVWAQVDGGGVLHAVEDMGVLFTKKAVLAMCGWGNPTYWQFNAIDAHPR